MSPRRLLPLAILLPIAVALALLVRHHLQAVHLDGRYTAKRAGMVQLNAAIAPPQNFVALGDSITESVYLNDVCGPSFNAGIGGARIADVARLADHILPILRPHVILVAVGTNDIWSGAGIAAFRQDYGALLTRLPHAKILLMGVPNNAAAAALIRQLAADHRATYVPPVTGPANTIGDGAHLKPAGAVLFRHRIAAACAGAQG